MQMPWILQSAVERELEGCPAQAVRAAALDLSRRYRESGRAPDGARLARSAEEVRAYAAFRMPATYAAVSRALEIAREAGLSDAQTLTDVGSGSGNLRRTSSAAHVLRHLSVVHNVSLHR